MTSVLADGEDNTGNADIDIGISPKDTLFEISNMKPGDWAPRTITVKNLGSKEFAYQMQLENSGEKKLFNELLLEIKADDKELYQGKLAAFKSLPARKLTRGSGENLDITIRFPEHLGNDFQGLGAAFVFSFTAEGRDNPGNGGGDNPGDGGSDNPAEGGSDNPAEGGSDNPAEGGSDNPAEEGSDNPAEEGSDNPAEGGSDSPAVQVTIPGQIDSGVPTTAGFNLPATSTNIFNLMLVGSVLVAGGIVLMIIRHYRRMKIAQ